MNMPAEILETVNVETQSKVVYASTSKSDNYSSVESISIKDPLTTINDLRNCINKLIPIEQAADEFDLLHEPHPISDESINDRKEIIKRKKKIKKEEITDFETKQLYKLLDSLKQAEYKINNSSSNTERLSLFDDIFHVNSQVDIHIARLRMRFRSHAHVSEFCIPIVENMIHKIEHKDFKDEAKMYLNSIIVEGSKLNFDEWTKPEFEVWCDRTLNMINIMMDMVRKRIVVEQLVIKDREKRKYTYLIVTIYIVVLLSATTGAIYFQGHNLNPLPLDKAKLPLLGIPWPVLLWSLLGSFAAMIHRLNKQAIAELGSIHRWLITRPIQGIILSAAVYMMLTAGLFVISGSSIDMNSERTCSVILFISFLVGFSDKFANNVFNTFVKNYSTSENVKANTSKEPLQNI
ncbi:hypothetical protein GXP67_12600 [Rhodocytophaga rosea]|uniref:Uncharacterized protein n=1 Tax=Rhodocytophaga rosea TaxID=2704465 RepID=A0A6C0GI94_9BACT|nr:hypothetical protein [Rhodocytophaga rosea]QHT67413.1 hypothetical protein GXP67_12600 [Rhodocytophaga rosea]